ncbi:syndecan-like [Copidosoma floridanum]|uniref:syndecan-like n=1 Tax=Copidosoma floridanum TaxID=29053 RepID=UPI0006C9C3B4|nr:syndecan-like [Copidosoma floridanum]
MALGYNIEMHVLDHWDNRARRQLGHRVKLLGLNGLCGFNFLGLRLLGTSVDGILYVSAVIGGAVVGLLCAILVVMFIVYRMRKKDEGSYALDEPRRSPAANSYPKPGATQQNREFYA